MAKKTAARKPIARKTPARASKPASAAPKRPRLPKLPADLKRGIEAALDRKAVDLVVLDLRKTSAFTDFFVICTGTNSRQVKAIADAVQETLKQDGIRPALVEGYDRADWILVDYFDFIFHVFSPPTREFYSLERLWGDAERLELTA
jgi:ribosome-associated protein